MQSNGGDVHTQTDTTIVYLIPIYLVGLLRINHYPLFFASEVA